MIFYSSFNSTLKYKIRANLKNYYPVFLKFQYCYFLSLITNLANIYCAFQSKHYHIHNNQLAATKIHLRLLFSMS